MYLYISFVIGALLAILTSWFYPAALPWIVFLFLGYAVALVALGVCFLFVCSLPYYRKTLPERDNRFCRVLAYLTMDSILALFRLRCRGIGLDKIPQEPCVIVCNHLSRFDPMVNFVLMPHRKLGFVSKKENMQIPIVGPITSQIGFVPLDRENPLRAMRTIHSCAKMISQKGYTLGIYPEGKRSKDGTLLEFKSGAFVMAKKADCPIAICAIKGTNEYRKNLPFSATPVTLECLEILSSQQVREKKPEELALYCRERIKQVR